MNLGGTQVAHEALLLATSICTSSFTNLGLCVPVEKVFLRHGKSIPWPANYRDSPRRTLPCCRESILSITPTLAVRPEFCRRTQSAHSISICRPLRRRCRSATFEFKNRPDGLDDTEAGYRLRFAGEVGIDGSPRYLALANDDVRRSTPSTDGLLRKFDLVVLEDDQQYFPALPYRFCGRRWRKHIPKSLRC